MREFLERIRLITSIWAWVMIALGVLLIFNPGQVLVLVCRISGVLFVLTGVSTLVTTWYRRAKNIPGLKSTYPMFILGGVLLAAGVFIVVNPKAIMGFLAILFAIILLINATNDIVEMRTLRMYGVGKWFLCLVSFVVKFIFAILLIMKPFDSEAMVFVVAGIGLIYAGVSALLVNFNIVRGYRNFNKAAQAAAREADLRNGIVDGTLLEEEIIDVDEHRDLPKV